MQRPTGSQYPNVFKQVESAGLLRGIPGYLPRRHTDDDKSDICLDLSSNTKGYDAKEPVLKLAPRIRLLKLGREVPTGFGGFYDPSSTLVGHFTRLEGLSVDVPLQYTEPANGPLLAKGDARAPLRLHSLLECLTTINCLRQLHLNFGPYDQTNLTASSHYKSIFSRLTHISIQGSMPVNEFLMILSYCTNAVEINLDTRGVLEPKVDKSTEPIQLPALQWLKIATNEFAEAILRRIECPVLENLFIMNGTPPEPFQRGNTKRYVHPYKNLPVMFWDSVHIFLASCMSLRQVVLAVNCSWKDMRTHALSLDNIKAIQEVDLRVMDPKGQDCAPKNPIEHWVGMAGCNAHNGYISHVGKTAREGVHMGTPLRPTDWELGFWHTEDSLKDLAFSSSWKN